MNEKEEKQKKMIRGNEKEDKQKKRTRNISQRLHVATVQVTI